MTREGISAFRRGVPEMRRTQGSARSDAAHDEQDEDDDEEEADQARWTIAPASAVSPGGQGADEEQDEEDQEDRAEHERHQVTGFSRATFGGRLRLRPGSSGGRATSCGKVRIGLRHRAVPGLVSLP